VNVALAAGAAIALTVGWACIENAMRYRNTNRVATYVYAIESLFATSVAAMCIAVLFVKL
jgi:hypothetical protein